MRILHLTDLHYSKKNQLLIDRLKTALLAQLEKENNISPIDLILFTGDLVNAGDENMFSIADENFITPICEILKQRKENFIICSGNHDMQINKEFNAIKEYINRFSSNDELDDFVSKADAEFENSCLNATNFNQFIKEFYKDSDSFHFNELYQVHKTKIGIHKIGIVSFNSAWRSFIGKDSGLLLIPRIAILESHEKIKDCGIKICLLHHDLSEVKPFNSYVIEDLIYELFHLKFSGHYHKKRQEAYILPNIGMLSFFSPSTMSKDDGSKIGFSILDIDEELLEGEVANFDYSRSDNVFTKTNSLPINIPVNKEKKDQLEVLKALKSTYEKALIEANDLLVCDDASESLDFLELFSPPSLKAKSKAQTIEEKKEAENIDFDKLYSECFIVYGKDKSGKTSLLRKLELDLLMDYKFTNKIPLYIDFKSVDHLNISLLRILKQTLSLSNKKTEKLMDDGMFTLLVDNFNPDKTSHRNTFNTIASRLNVVSCILTSDETFTSPLEKIDIIKDVNKLFLHYLTRADIRSHTKKWLGNNDSGNQQVIIKKIETIFSQLNIPFNYWSLSLFLWLYKKEKKINIHDNIELVNLYIDGLLERKQLAISTGNIDYDTFRSFLGELAHELLTKHLSFKYSMTYEQLVNFIEDYKKKNIRFVAESEELLDFLITRGILKKQIATSRYTFRLNGVMEFFIAFYMKENPAFTEEVIKDELFFLEFANELEIYAGFVKNDTNFLTQIRNKVEKSLDLVNSQYAGMNPDDVLISKIKHIDEIANLASAIDPTSQTPIAYSEQDELLDDIKPLDCFEEEVRIKTPIASSGNYTHTELEKLLFILCRVFRSLSLVTDKAEVDKTLDFILDSVINLGFKLLEEITIDEEKDEKEKEKFLINLISSFIPLIVQMNLSEAILQKNLKRLIEEKINELNQNKKKNQYKLFILYYMLLDIDLEENINKIDEIVETFSLYPLKNTSLFKLYYLLLFKANGSISLQDKLKAGIISQQLKINNKQDKSQIAQNLNKQLMIHKQKEKD